MSVAEDQALVRAANAERKNGHGSPITREALLTGLIHVTGLTPTTADAVRGLIERGLDLGRELDRLQVEFGAVGTELDDIADTPAVSMSMRHYRTLEAKEQSLARRIDDIRRTLGVLNDGR